MEYSLGFRTNEGLVKQENDLTLRLERKRPNNEWLNDEAKVAEEKKETA